MLINAQRMNPRTGQIWLALFAIFAYCCIASCGSQQAANTSPCDAQPHNVTAVKDLRYGPDANFNGLDLYLPAQRAGEPLVVFVHGGGWVAGDKGSYGHMGYALARCGIAFANINYPLAPHTRANAQADAVINATQWLRARAPIYGYAADHVFMMGHSAGAELVTLAVLRAQKSTNNVPSGVSGVIALDGLAYSPAVDFAGSQRPPDLPRHYAAAFGPTRTQWQQFDVSRGIHGHEPPFVIVHGLDDTYAPVADSQRLADTLGRAGDAVTFLQPSGRDHNTVIVAIADDPGDPTARTIERFIFSNGARPASAHRRSKSFWNAFAGSIASAASKPSGKLPRPDRVVIIVEENHSFSSIIGNSKAPYLNQLAKRGALFTQSFAITHPSAPNYIALFSGQTNNNGDDCPERGVPTDAPNLGGELIAAGLTFTGYSETMPRAGFTGCFAGFAAWSYARKHNPWVNFNSVPTSDNQPFSALPQFKNLPTVAFIIPNQAHDMHSASIEDGDTWLQHNVGALIDWSATHNTLVIVTWDEDDGEESNHIATIFVGAMIKSGRYDKRIDHYSVLRTLEDMYGLPHVGNSKTAAAISDCWR